MAELTWEVVTCEGTEEHCGGGCRGGGGYHRFGGRELKFNRHVWIGIGIGELLLFGFVTMDRK